MFRAKEGRYPDSLGELITSYYFDVGVKKPYLNKMPAELISNKKGNNEYVTQSSDETLSGSGGWVYITDTAEVKVNVTGTLGKKWGEYADEDPSEW